LDSKQAPVRNEQSNRSIYVAEDSKCPTNTHFI
jgi:hypothetical protein